MRIGSLLLLLAWGLAQAQDATDGDGGCYVVAGSVEVDESGRLVSPAPTAGDCTRAGSLEAKFRATPPREFGQVNGLARFPEHVRRYIEGVIVPGNPGNVRNPVNVQTGRYPVRQLPPVVVWLGRELVVVIWRSSDLSGTATNVFLADLETLNACEYLSWRGAQQPALMTIAGLQRALEERQLGEREAPACHLQTLPLD